MSDRKYNGWTNYETWLVALWLDNEPYSYEHMNELARDAVADDLADWQLGEHIRDFVEETYLDEPNTITGLVADLVNAAMSEVDWTEIAEHYLCDARDNGEIDYD